ncbi:RsiV family protein [Aquicella lusitana]|uniref:Uncharacterized protein DUF3298 n=1 Tax=Aquicella lusitana TaxID=254246 RepID=A0A370GG82_9COXI|nr:RsiV family protein [Aquicella lusitana]RDI42815.1 uncharacterized protein DUF3298 [Aquicella lusitana]VVC73058.1 Peptidoglycan-N-acetylmuramic acid deacetylase PdaC [Aquicella lusitana]
MKKLLLLVIVVLFSQYVFAEQTAFEKKKLSLPNGFTFKSKMRHESSKEPPYQIKAKSPELAGNLNSQAKQFNQLIDTAVSGQIDQFKKEVVKSFPDIKNLPESVRQNNLDIFYDLSTVSAGSQTLLSVRFNNEFYFAGAAHPGRKIQVVNYDLQTGKQLALNDLFKANSNYLNVIATYSREQLKKELQQQDNDWFEKGTAPKSENYKNWNLLPEGILFTFEEYQVAAYVFGQPEVLVPYKVLESVIAPASPIAACVKTPESCK